ncbi:MSHA biogenesis protein MshK [Vibrio sp. SCSIO 43136]|uniref:MSHA biogenesis protein MshK n=1 Tax=Vibrio sp. SCSIO 43136 TaxID=2819101 RepID=UPI003365A36C
MVRLITALFACALLQPAFSAQDPTAPLGWSAPATVTKAKPKSRFRLPVLNSIVCQTDVDCVAVVDNKLVEQGGRVSGFVASRIEPDFVIVKQGTRQWRLELFAKDIKQ